MIHLHPKEARHRPALVGGQHTNPSFPDVEALFARTYPTANVLEIVPLASRLCAARQAVCGWKITFHQNGYESEEYAFWLGTRFHLTRTLDIRERLDESESHFQATLLPGKTIWTLGYRQPGGEGHLMRLTKEGYLLLDIRKRAGSRFDRAYNRGQLVTRFGDFYHHIPELGNVNYPCRPFVLVDQMTGLENAVSLLKQAPGVILLCACADWHECHRSLVADLLKERFPAVHILHLETDK